jgi:hypothetical protein
MISTSPILKYEKKKTDLSNSLLFDNDNSQNFYFEDFNNNDETISKIIHNNNQENNLPKYYENKINIPNNINDKIFFKIKKNKFSTPKKKEKKVELIPDVFNDSSTENKNIIISDLDIKLISTNKSQRKKIENEKEKDLKTTTERNLNDYFEKNNLYNYNNNNLNSDNTSEKVETKKNKIVNMKDSKFYYLLTSEKLNKKITFKNIYKSVPKSNKIISFENILGKKKYKNKNDDDKFLNSTQKVTNSTNSTNYSNSTNKKKINNKIYFCPKLTQFTIRDNISDKKTPNSSNKQISSLSIYKDKKFVLPKESYHIINSTRNNNYNKKNKNKVKIPIKFMKFFSSVKNNNINIKSKFKLVNLNSQNNKKNNIIKKQIKLSSFINNPFKESLIDKNLRYQKDTKIKFTKEE